MDNVHKLSDSEAFQDLWFFTRFLQYLAGFQIHFVNVPNHE
jgi:hypothetical protein